jgi:hypothetical protein
MIEISEFVRYAALAADVYNKGADDQEIDVSQFEFTRLFGGAYELRVKMAPVTGRPPILLRPANSSPAVSSNFAVWIEEAGARFACANL